MRAVRRGALVVTLAVAASSLGFLSACGGGTDAPDATVSDVPALDAAPACETADDCDDGLVCNGQEACVSGRCAAGAAIRCDDGVACTTDVCSEELRRCVSRPVDADGDGFASAACVDARGVPLGEDCDDASASVYPGALELCDAAGIDEDCNPETLGGRDLDGDGRLDAACCNGSRCGDDCNDAIRGIPADREICNGLDDDCDGSIDEGELVRVYRDADGDGHGDPSMPAMGCGARAGYVPDDRDCDDASALRSPTLPEVCDGIDNDCDGVPDPEDAPVVARWYADGDGDGFGDPLRSIEACAPPAGHALLGTDCDDTNAARHPAQRERCNGVDDDCNGVADFVIAPGDLEDDDLDGVPDAACPMLPAGAPRDCEDRDASSHGDALELCDGRDNDCDGRIDEGVESTRHFRDVDGDGWGSEAAGVVVACGVVPGHTIRGGDCDEGSNLRHPGAIEGCNGVDEDCDGAIDETGASPLCPEGRACVAGRCRIPRECPSGLADCDGVAGNGCETSLTSDPTNCGVCGRRCASEPGARGVCSDSRCAPLACDPGLLDCNGDLGRGLDGCEHPARCGACGTTGPLELCLNGSDDDCDGRIDEGC
jgi:hypothetical protein